MAEETHLQLKLSHYSRTPLEEIQTTKDSITNRALKPSGLWVSVGGEFGWPEWVRSEEFYPENLVHKYDVTIAPNASILYLNSIRDLDKFTEDWPNTSNPLELKDDFFNNPKTNVFAIDWIRVSDSYDGIIISPYQWGRRLELMWYYSWDCASGCIWNKEAILDIKEDKSWTGLETS